MTKPEILVAEGHNLDGCCEKCWGDAFLFSYGGNGKYGSQGEAYRALLAAHRERAKSNGVPAEHRRHGRREPYTLAGVRRLPCFRCGARAEYQWNVCSDSNLYRPLCAACDVALNTLVLRWMEHPEAELLATEYAAARNSPTSQDNAIRPVDLTDDAENDATPNTTIDDK